MKQKLNETHAIDANGNPAGGTTYGGGISILWQDGPLGRGDDRKEPNGAFVEGVIQAAIGRLQFYQKAGGGATYVSTGARVAGKLACRENAIAITKLEEALMWLEMRTRDREEREVEGTYAP